MPELKAAECGKGLPTPWYLQTTNGLDPEHDRWVEVFRMNMEYEKEESEREPGVFDGGLDAWIASPAKPIDPIDLKALIEALRQNR